MVCGCAGRGGIMPAGLWSALSSSIKACEEASNPRACEASAKGSALAAVSWRQRSSTSCSTCPPRLKIDFCRLRELERARLLLPMKECIPQLQLGFCRLHTFDHVRLLRTVGAHTAHLQHLLLVDAAIAQLLQVFPHVLLLEQKLQLCVIVEQLGI